MSLSFVLGVKRWISKLYSHCWKGFNTQKCWKTKEYVGAEGFFQRTAVRFTVTKTEKPFLHYLFTLIDHIIMMKTLGRNYNNCIFYPLILNFVLK